MPYKPTGRPAGRPAKPKQTEGPVKFDPPAVHPPTQTAVVPPEPGREGTERAADGTLCAECFPAGWPYGATGLGCPHGAWTRRVNGA